MVKKLQKMSADQKTAGLHLSSAVKDSAQQIWLAGLGAFSKAQEEGSKVFDALVKEGLTIQRRTQAATEEKITEATSRMSDMASDLQSRAGNRWDKLENIFEERVAKALGKLGVPSAREVSALAERLDRLDQQLRQLGGGEAPEAPAAPQEARPAPRRRAAAQAGNGAAPAAAKKTRRPAAQRAAARPAGTPAEGSAAATPATAE